MRTFFFCVSLDKMPNTVSSIPFPVDLRTQSVSVDLCFLKFNKFYLLLHCQTVSFLLLVSWRLKTLK